MNADILMAEDIEFGKKVKVIALCSNVEIIQNFSTTNSFREVYTLNGKEGAYIEGIIFKMNGAEPVDKELFIDQPVLVEGTIGEYRDAKQIVITSIGPLGHMLDKTDLLANMVDTRILDQLNEMFYKTDTLYSANYSMLEVPIGLRDAGAGTYATRLLKLLTISFLNYPEEFKEYVANISLLTNYYMRTDIENLDEKLALVHATNSTMVKALLFGAASYPEYDEFIKIHHLIMKPRGYTVEILDIHNIGTNHGINNIL